ncbi:MAG TPA: hypothetical protein VLA33_04325 [Gemmatimonadota bacterium]|nr:hypothetical protein [Gemmatimonadota bacterium]
MDASAGAVVASKASGQRLEGEPSDRMFVGRLGLGDVFELNDGKGRPRLRIVVAETGAVRIEFIHEAGTITKTIDGS